MTTRLPCSLRARLALGISISTMARARRSLSALSWPLVNGMAGRAALGLEGPAAGRSYSSLSSSLAGSGEFAAPIMDPCRHSSDDEAAGSGACRPPPSFCGKRRERAAKARRNRWVSSERLSRHGIMREVSLFEHSHCGAHAGIRDSTRPAPAFSGQKPANTRHSWEDARRHRVSPRVTPRNA
jgi:hypothetical protein